MEKVIVAHPAKAILGAAAELVCAYFRVHATGLENIPKEGPAILIANHSGFSGADAVVLTHLIRSRLGREVHVLAHPFYFRSLKVVRDLALRAGLREATFESGVKCLQEGHLLLVFPEGERGNFKSSFKRYQLQEFQSGFVRLAHRTGAPVVPCTIIGAEESHLSLGNLSLDFLMPGLRVPLPLNLLPLPARWKIRIFPAHHYRRGGRGHGRTQNWIFRETQKTREELQELIEAERGRKYAA